MMFCFNYKAIALIISVFKAYYFSTKKEWDKNLILQKDSIVPPCQESDEDLKKLDIGTITHISKQIIHGFIEIFFKVFLSMNTIWLCDKR